MELKDDRLIDFINKKNADNKNFDLERFLNPSVDDFFDAKNIKNMTLAAEKINDAVKTRKHILIYGDYDCDGICSCTILYLFLKGKGANVDVFIPSRFENGYGISIDAIEEIEERFSPDLIVTVDLGITAVEEVEILKQEGIDVVITDHHLPLAEIPDTVVVDPKLCAEEYGFDGLCGAGVALKLVEAMSSREEALTFVDICAIATVGDIVPLVLENRAIAKLGIDKINRKNCLKSIIFLLKKLELESINSTDISFKIVPRINACGRMDNALKVFEFLIEESDIELERKYAEIEGDNSLRLMSIDDAKKVVDKCLDKYDFNEPSILIHGDFHEGIVGIVASKVAHEYGRPAIIFTTNEDGNFRGSGRSVEGLDLHEIIAEMGDILINFGGHKMAIGVEIAPENFEVFKSRLNEKILKKLQLSDLVIDERKYDILLDENDLNEEFFEQVKMLEPFGCENESPIFAIKIKETVANVISEKSFRHYKLLLGGGKEICAFASFKNLAVIRSKSEKILTVDLVENIYKNKRSLAVYLKNVWIENADFSGQEEWDLMVSIKNKYYSIFDDKSISNYHICSDLETVIKQKLSESDFGTLIVASTNEDIEFLRKIKINLSCSLKPFQNGQNVVVANPFKDLEIGNIKSYKNIIFLHRYFDNENLFYSQKFNVFEPEKKSVVSSNLSFDREVFAKCYKLLLSSVESKSNNAFDLAMKLANKYGEFSASQIFLAELVFFELNFIEFDEILCTIKVLKSKKAELSKSKLYAEVCEDVKNR